MRPPINWPEAIKPLIKKYKGQKHPLVYKNNYQLLVGVVLSAQDSDRHINQLGPELFKAFPDMTALSHATPETLFPFIGKVRNYANKTKWLIDIAQKVKKDSQVLFRYSLSLILLRSPLINVMICIPLNYRY